MAFKTLTLDDVLNDKVDEKAFEKPKKRNEKYYRTRTGEYAAILSKTYLREVASGPQEGRRFMSIQTKLYTRDGRYRGTCYTAVSWKHFSKANGEADLKFKLFQQLVSAMGAPMSTPLDEILAAIEGETVLVWGKEFFNVPTNEMYDKEIGAKLLADGRQTAWDFVEEDQDEKALYYLRKGYKSEFMVFRISELLSPADDEVPF